MKKNNPTRNQHTVPRCYLKYFSDDKKKIYRKIKKVSRDKKELEKELNQPESLDKATVKKDFYTFNNITEILLVEKLIYAEVIENDYPSLYKMLLDESVEGFNMETRCKLLMFFLSLHCRTPKQFKMFFETIVPSEYKFEMEKIIQDYKGAHVKEILPAVIEAHQFKVIKIVEAIDSCEFITSDNPVLFVNEKGELMNYEYKEQFNKSNTIIIPLDPKHCIVFFNATDKNGISVENKLFYNRIQRVKVDCSFVSSVNLLMLDNAEKYYFGTKKFIHSFFSLFVFK